MVTREGAVVPIGIVENNLITFLSTTLRGGVGLCQRMFESGALFG